jgi:hypothetical protein
MKLERLTALILFCCVAANAQQTPADSPAKPTAQSEAGEPRANTSASTPQASPKPAKGTAQSEAGEPRAATSPAVKTAPATGAAPAKKGPTQADRLELSTATVTGDREQPKVMYVVPWKRSDLGDLAGKPMNSLVDEILSPIDRDEFKREVRYYTTVKSDANQNGTQPPPGQGEK